MRVSLCVLLCSVAACLISAVTASHHKILVLVDENSTQDTHSAFLKSLSDRGYEVSVKLANSRDIEFKKYGVFLYDSLILLSPAVKKFGGDLSNDYILEFVDEGNSLIIAGSTNINSVVRDLAAQCGVKFSPEGHVVQDHVSFDAKDTGPHTLIVADKYASSVILGPKKHTPLLFRGVGLAVDETNPLAVQLLSGSPTTYCADPVKSVTQKDHTSGSRTTLVAAVQTLGRGRVLVSGSLDLFSDALVQASVEQYSVKEGKFVKGGASGNKQFIEETVGWTLHERGHLRAHSIFHKKQDGSEIMPRTYRVKDDIHFSIVIEEFDGVANTWRAFSAPDVQLEFVMIDPYVRTTLVPQGNGTFYVNFKVPDVYGVFKFNIDYRRDGYSHIMLEHEVGVRPFRHNEFERFIPSAFPYYASAFSMMGAFVLFSVLFLFTKDKKSQ